MRRIAISSLLVFLIVALAASMLSAQTGGTTNAPAAPPLPADIPKDAQVRAILSSGNLAGHEAVWRDESGAMRVYFEFNDRGRGPKLEAVYRLAPNGAPRKLSITGNDYMKSKVDESFAASGKEARWNSAAEHGNSTDYAGQFFSSMNGPAEELAMMARAMLKNGGHIALLPAGEAAIAKVRTLPVSGGTPAKATLYSITGLDLTPTYLWLDDRQELFASGGTWFMIIREGFEKSQPELVKAQEADEQARLVKLAAEAMRKPAGKLVIYNAQVLDVETGKVAANQMVTIAGNRIESVTARSGAPANASGPGFIDAQGGMLIPGMWDMHAHVSASDPLLNIAAGVTTARDLANDIDTLTALRKRIDAGEQIGPRIIPAGFIDGPGPYQGPSKILAADEKQAREYVAMYNRLGYPQIKIYSSLKPELVPAIIDEAHKRGMRVSGHIPAGMTAAECIRLGQDEIQHMNFVFLNLMPDVKETRTPARFTEPGKRAAGIDLNGPEVKAFIQLLREHKTVIDPTLSIWEQTYTDRPGKMSRNFTAVADRLPAQLQRGLKGAGQALPVTAETDQLYQRSYGKFKEMLKLLYDSGVTIVAGTDNFAGFAYQRELEIYVEAGIPPAEVLRIATIGSARVMNKDKELGSITPGKLADLVLIAGDPTTNISDIRKVRTVIKDGRVYDPAKIDAFLSIKP